ncbi:LamG-like jellyroll fold domain-containing protein [Paenibacillus yanchengensis]|uniref:LamG-like jellyroll fold domain-containing protein n=1 Tax=Paenibacillus yanchengensis TaxID=2035833 RepID=A0ABW4YF99_9BACL
MKNIKKFVSVLLVVIMIFTMPISVMAEESLNDTFSNQETEVTSPTPIIDLDMEMLTDEKVTNKADNQLFAVAGASTTIESGSEHFGQALRLDGTTNYINLGKEYQVKDEVTVAAWINIDGNANALSKIISRARTGVAADSEISLYVRKAKGLLESQIATWLPADETNTITPETWTHVAVTANKDFQIIYIDGIEVARTATESFDKAWNATDLLIGAGWNQTATAPFANHMFKGLLDEVKVYDVALSDKEIIKLAGKQQSSDASLREILLAGEPIGDFNAGTTSYDIKLAEGTTTVPTVTATPTFSEATVNLVQATEIPGIASIGVIAEDGTKQSYQINFSMKQVIDPGDPIIHFKMDEVTATGEITNEVDQKNYKINGTYTLENGIYGNSLKFDGSKTHVNLGKPDFNKNLTLAAWVNIDPGGGNSLNKIFGRDKTTVANHAFYFTIRNTGSVEFSLRQNDTISGTWMGSEPKAFPFDVWNHVAVTRDGASLKMYLNGKLIKEGQTPDVDLSVNEMDLLLGAGWNADGTDIFPGHSFKGRMDEVKVFNHALSEDQINKIAEDAAGRIPPEVIKVTPSAASLLDENTSKLVVEYNMALEAGENFSDISLVGTSSGKVGITPVIAASESSTILTNLLITLNNKLSAGEDYMLTIPQNAVKNTDLVGNLETIYTYSIKQSAVGNAENSSLDYWVLNPVTIPSKVEADEESVVLSNGLVKREFSLQDNFMTINYSNTFTEISLLDEQHLQADALVVLDGEQFNIGGKGDSANTFKYDSHKVENSTEKLFNWTYDPKISDPSMKDLPWPAKGKALIVTYKAGDDFANKYKGISIQVRYEIYDGIPVISKKIAVTNNGEADVVIQKIIVEALPISKQKQEMLYVESEFNSGNSNHSRNNGRHNTTKYADLNDTSVLMTSQYGTDEYATFNPNYRLTNNTTFNGYRVYELFHSVDYYEWKMMEVKKMYRTLFPQIGDNPTIFHLVSNNAAVIKTEIDKASEVGFDMIISSFGSGVNIENVSKGNIDYYKDIYDYAKEKEMMMGSYVMMVARGDQPAGEGYSGVWGNMRCMTSQTAEKWYADVLKFIDETGLKSIEIDGIYPNSACFGANEEEKYSSIVKQWEKATKKFNQDLRERNVYINAPDWNYLTGANKGVMGYEEIAFSQPRLEQLIYGRMIAYHGTYAKTPSMGWTLVPFSQYHGGGDAATFMPFDKKIKDYDYIVALNFMSGIAGSFRGPSLYDSDMSKNVMSYWGNYFNTYKEILNGDVVHIAPPRFKAGSNNQLTDDIDGIIHTSAQSKQKGMVVLYNQTGEKVTKKVTVPLYYTGLTDQKMPPAPMKDSHYEQMPKYGAWPPVDYYYPIAPEISEVAGVATDRKAVVSQGDINGKEYAIDSNGNIEIDVVMEPNSYAWYTVYDPKQVPEQMTVEIKAPEHVRVASRTEQQITISWDAVSVNGNQVKDYNVYRNGIYTDKVFETKYVDTNVTEGSEYSYEIVPVHHTVYGQKSVPLFVSTEKDNISPTIESVKAISDYTLHVVFSEKVSNTSAETLANYAVEGNSVTAVQLGADGITVTLTVANKIIPFMEHEIVVNNIKDISVNANTIATNSKAKFTHGYLRHFGFDEKQGKIATDQIHQLPQTNGTISGDFPSRMAGVKDNALLFDGNQTYVDIASVVDKMDVFSIDGWFKPDNITEEQTIIGQQQDFHPTYGWTYRWNLYLDEDGKLKYLISDDSGKITLELDSDSHKVGLNEWNHFALVREGDQFKLFLNGRMVDEASEVGIVQPKNHNAMFIGAYKNGAGGEPTRLFKGIMDEIIFYNVPISNDFVVERFNSYSETGQTKLDAIRIDKLPTKVKYNIGEKLDVAGLMVKAIYSDNSESIIENYTVTGFDSTTVGTKKITIRYRDKEATFDVSVKEKDNVLTPPPYIPSMPEKPSESEIPKGELVNPDITTDEDGNVLVDVTEEIMDSAIETARAGSDGSKQVVLTIETEENQNQLNISIPLQIMQASEENIALVIQSSLGSVTLTNETIHNLKADEDGNINIILRKSKTVLQEDAKTIIGDRPVIDVGVLTGTTTSQADMKLAFNYDATTTEKEDYEHIIVYKVNADGTLHIVPNGKYDPATGKVSVTGAANATYAIGFVKKQFSDTASVSWAEKSISILASRGIINGTTETTFSPEDNITRADFLKLLVDTLGLQGDSNGNFADISKGAHYYEQIAIAKSLGLAQGVGENKFKPNTEISRQEMMVLVSRALKAANKEVEQGIAQDLASFADGAAVAAYAIDSVSALVKEGIIIGTGKNIDPKGYTTRAQTAVVLYKLFQR